MIFRFANPSISLFSILYLCVWCSTVSAETIEGALARAYVNNPDFNAQRAAGRATDEDVQRARSAQLPTVDANSSFGRQSSTYNAANEVLTPRTLGLSVTQSLFNGGRVSNRIDQSEKAVLATREQLRSVEQRILLGAAAQYMAVVRDRAVLKARQANINVLKEQLRQTEDRFNVGEITRTDVAQVSAQLAAAEAERSAAQANLASSVASYERIIGATPDTLAEAVPLVKSVPISLEQALQIGQAEHPDIQATRHNVDIASVAVKIAEGELLPSLALSGTLTHARDYREAGDELNDASLVARLTVPLFEGGEVYARVRQLKETLGQRRLDADSVRQAVMAEISSAWSQYMMSESRITAAETQIEAATIALDGTREEAKVGQRTTLDVLISDQTLLGAQVNLVTAQTDRVVASYRVLASIGKLSARTLGLKVKLYDPKVHYDKVKGRLYGSDIQE
ncbi:MAG: TolC family outer membrane protein [Hyphomicrobiales bacterium]